MRRRAQVVSGASTITMQLARNLFMGPDQRYAQSMDRKLLEAGLAQELTTLFRKDELLEMYLNLLNYGHLTYGPEAASQVYFGGVRRRSHPGPGVPVGRTAAAAGQLRPLPEPGRCQGRGSAWCSI